MKKVLALVLAVMMMATVAMAADVTIGEKGGNPSNTARLADPGDTIVIYPDAFKNGDNTLDSGLARAGEFSNANFSVTTRRFDKGTSLVKSVEIDDDKNAVVIKLNNDYSLKRTDTVNLVIKELKVTAKKKLEGGTVAVAKGSKWTYDLDTKDKNFIVGYKVEEENIQEDWEVSGTNGLTKFLKKDNISYGTATIIFGEVATATGRVYDKDVIYLDFDEKVNVDVVKKYPDADLKFVNFKGDPTFNSNFEVEIYADEDSYIYALKDGVLSATTLKWDDDAYAFVGKVRTLGSYVISDTKLATAAAGTDNPDTGANDVVGIATALAAVALVSAAAVSLKK